MNSSRRRALRAVLSALAGGGLTAASLSGPLAPGAIGAVMPAGATGVAEGAAVPTTTSGPHAGSQETTAAQPSNTSSTTPSTAAAPAPPVTPAPTGATGPQTTGPQSAGPVTGTPQSAAPQPAVIVLQRKQKTTATERAKRNVTVTHVKGKARRPKAGATGATGAKGTTGAKGVLSAPNNVAMPPQLVAAQAEALAVQLASSAASAQALAFYRIPLFLLPIYQAAGVQYGVPWQILAAINEIETDYGSDQSVSTAGAVGWMQFEPSTWTGYGVDAVNAGYADPYNPVDAIFAAARYLRAAGAATDLRGAILAYNHSNEYADSVLLRAKLISTYPKAVIATLTGLVDDRLPVTGRQLAWSAPLPTPSSATASAVSTPPQGQTGATGSTGAQTSPAAGAATQSPVTPGSSAPPEPAVAAAAGTGKAASTTPPPQLVELVSAANAKVVAVQDGRILKLGSSRKLGKYVVLRDLYGDVFTYAGLGSIAPTYVLPTVSPAAAKAPIAGSNGHDPAPTQPATAGSPLPLTLQVKTAARQSAPTQDSIPAGSAESAPAGMGKVRLFAHPGNPDAVAAAANAASRALAASRQSIAAGHRQPLRRGSVVAEGTVLGRVRMPRGAKDGHLRFAIRPAGDPATVDPRAILENWVQLEAALHPQGAKGESKLLGATVNEVFLLSKSQLEREVLSDPGIVMSACSRREVNSGHIDQRVLAVLAFLSRSGLKPTVGTLRCGNGSYDVSGYVPADHLGDAVAISEVNGMPIAGHQGSGSITDTTIRTLLTLKGEFVPRQIVSLMHYPHDSRTVARHDHGAYIELDFSPASERNAAAPAASQAAVAHSAGAGQTAPSPLAVSSELGAAQWEQLLARIAALPAPKVDTKPSSSAIPDLSH
jgi:soluble lytic murein transglycosylase-like protein